MQVFRFPTASYTYVLDLQCPWRIAETFSTTNTVQDVVNRIAKKASVHINPEEQDSCGLFLPTAKSKKGVFMEYSRTIKSFRLRNRVIISLSRNFLRN